MLENDPFLSCEELQAANRRHDDQQHEMSMNPGVRYKSMNIGTNIVKDLLTDKKIEKYEKLGFYSPEYRAARKEFSNRKVKRRGNFDEVDGRMIYRP